MRRKTTRRLAITVACCLGIGASTTTLARGHGGGIGGGGGHFESHGFGAGNASFGHTQFRSPHGSNSSFLGHTKSKTKHSGFATTKTKKSASAKKFASRGNSTFGHKQGDPVTRTRGSQNSAFGQARAAAAHGDESTIGTAIGSGGPGNSDFGHKQGDPATRTMGSQNSAFGQARAAAAHGDDNTIGTVLGSDNATGPGNSDFGHRQGDPETRTTGSQNSAFGQARAAEAKAQPAPSPNP